MKKTTKAVLAATVLFSAFAAAPAMAEDAAPITITGTATLATEYNFRGISQTDRDATIQGGLTVSHTSGLYVATWGSNLAGNGTWGGANMELDLIGGFTKGFGAATIDTGVIYYAYPGTSGHDYFEPYASVSGMVGPVKAKVGLNWTPPQNSIRPAGQLSKGNNIWIYNDLALPIGGTPLTLKSHVGYSSGDSIYTYGKDVVDYGFGVDVAYKALTFNVSYIGTDMNKTFAAANLFNGREITKGRVMASVTAAF